MRCSLGVGGVLLLLTRCGADPLVCSTPKRRDSTGQSRRVGRDDRLSLPTQPMRLPGSREPSGAVALPHLGGILIVDDEPTESPSAGIHFVRVSGTRLTDLPVDLPDSWRGVGDDWEGATATEEHVYLLGSHARQSAIRSKICRFPKSAMIVEAQRVRMTGPLHCAGGWSQRDRILDVLNQAARRHGFQLPDRFETAHPKRGGLNIEGFSYDHRTGDFLLGLRSPLAEVGTKEYAILLAMRWHRGQPQFAHTGLIDLDGRGIRALLHEKGGSVLLSAGPPGKRGRFDLFRVRPMPNRPFVRGRPTQLTPQGARGARSWFKPEGLARYGKTLFLFNDTGDWPHGPATYWSWIY